MKAILALFTAFLLLGCGGSSNNADDKTAVCQQNDVNSKIFCALQKNYLWYKDLPENVDLTVYTSPDQMLAAVKAPQDRYSFIMTEQDYNDRYINATYFGYGYSQALTEDKAAYSIAYVYANGSAAKNGLARGDKIIEIEGISVSEWVSMIAAGTATEQDMLGENAEGVMRQFVWLKPNGDQITANLIKGDVSTNTVLHKKVFIENGKRIGYLVFNTFIELSETELEQAFTYFKQLNVNEIILDVRYNGGGLIRVANQLASHIALSHVINKTFVKYQYNDKNSFKNTTTLFSLGAGRTSLNLPRLVVLTTQSSCSSSELVINSLAPFIDVVQIGTTTCGKPVGQQPELISNYVLFAINFQTVNALDQGEYFDGLLPNCHAEDKIVADWGVTTDPLLAEALYYVNNEKCSTAGTNQAFAVLSNNAVSDSASAPATAVGLAAQFATEK